MRHLLTNIDPDRRLGDCSFCGPSSKIRPRRRPDGSVSSWRCRYRAPGESRYAGSKSDQRRYRYRLSREEYAELLAVHGEACAICGGSNADRRLAIDHCHRSLRVRGLLCAGCNRGLGFFGDDPERLAAAIAYLTRPDPKPGRPGR